ncbi:MAG: hypothetical protein IT435_18060, partial [Phycisphaerales bacterium]|nr:hypothetical protein [Phycisphaerales bacterium]
MLGMAIPLSTRGEGDTAGLFLILLRVNLRGVQLRVTQHGPRRVKPEVAAEFGCPRVSELIDRKEARMAGTKHRRRRARPLDTIWRCPDELWEKVERVLDELDPPAATGRPRVDPRKALDGMIY